MCLEEGASKGFGNPNVIDLTQNQPSRTSFADALKQMPGCVDNTLYSEASERLGSLDEGQIHKITQKFAQDTLCEPISA